MITETLTGQASYLLAVNFQTQLLKVVFTTLYVDVKEPAISAHSASTKKPNLAARLDDVAVYQSGQN